MYTLRIPLKPVSLNSAYMVGKGNNFILSKNGKKFKEDCQDFLSEQYTKKPLKGKLKADVLFQLRSFREKVDLDNMLKLTFDSMTGIVFDDDSQIYKLIAEKEIGMKRDEIHIIIYEID
jgi:Holliday junction resolvase RusA-like endonuclease